MNSMDQELIVQIKNNPHLLKYLVEGNHNINKMVFKRSLSVTSHIEKNYNILYPLTNQVFAHVYRDSQSNDIYNVVEPILTPKLREKLEKIKESIYHQADYDRKIEFKEELRQMVLEIFEKVVTTKSETGILSKFITDEKIRVKKKEIPTLRYYILRDMVDFGVINSMLFDDNIEDIHIVGTSPITLIHSIFGEMKSNIRFETPDEIDNYLKKISQRIDSPIGESHPIVDSALPDGSRVNIVYPDDVSRRGRSFTIRKFPEVPISITELIANKTVTSELAAYLWLCLENSMSIFICGSSSVGKTTTMNALLPFVFLENKIYSVEDTPEVKPPQMNWQQLIVREEGSEDEQVGMFDLLKAALRSRPDYIVPSEIRGEEGRVAFQAMQTGHPVISTFHASSVVKMIQRLTGDPILIPITFVDNLNVAVIQENVTSEGRLARRVTEVGEIEGYSEAMGGVINRIVFKRNPIKDELKFEGLYNSFILEDKIANIQGYIDKRKIYEDMKERVELLDDFVNKKIFEYDKVTQLIDEWRKGGRGALSVRL
ncbi:MAG: type II/IV secretion system ATPase subunit [Thermoplasmata archaeon]